MSVDTQGVRRGSCSRCDCKQFTTKHVKCRCGHPPTAHVDVDAGRASGPFAYHGKDITNAVGSYSGYRRQSSREFPLNQQNPGQRSCHKCSSMYPTDIGACPICYQRDNCPCGNMKFFDPLYGAFQYCSPSCRDNRLLPEYNKKLQEYLSDPLHINGTPPSVGFRNTADTSPHVTSTSSASDGTSVVTITEKKQSIICEQLPMLRSFIHFYKHVWSEDGKYGLYVTGLTLGEDTSLCLADLICGTATALFDDKTTYNDMMTKYKAALYGRIFRKFDFKLICKKAKEKGLAEQCDIRNQNIAFFLLSTQVSGIGLTAKNQQVIILEVNQGSIAELSGIRTGDVIRSIGHVNLKHMDKFEFKNVTEEADVTLTAQPLTVIGSVLIIERSKFTISRV